MLGRVLVPFALFANSVVAAEPPVATTIDARDLESGAAVVIGVLGERVGTLVEIEATVVGRKHETFGKVEDNLYRLRVVAVNRNPLPKPVLMQFRTEGSSGVTVAGDPAALVQLKTGVRRSGTEEELHAWESDYVGSVRTLLAYEDASFKGTPRNPFGFRRVTEQGWLYQFETHLIIVDEFPRIALDDPGSLETVVVSTCDEELPADEDAIRDYLFRNFVRAPSATRYAQLRTANAGQDLLSYRDALVAKARLAGLDDDALARCIASAIENYLHLVVAVPVAATACRKDGNDVWIITWAFGHRPETSTGVVHGLLPSDVTERWSGCLRFVAAQGYRMKDGSACTYYAASP